VQHLQLQTDNDTWLMHRCTQQMGLQPDMGEGLNKPAEISLYKIVKRDANGTIIRQGEDFQKFVHKLKHMSSRQGTEFVSYDEERGIWKFRVEHFSRYSSSTSFEI